jgi:Rho GDP-dissociation inhibitor
LTQFFFFSFAAELAQLDAEDESLARWKASLGITADSATVKAEGPKVSHTSGDCLYESHSNRNVQLTVLSLFLMSGTPLETKITIDLTDKARLARLKDTPVSIKQEETYR